MGFDPTAEKPITLAEAAELEFLTRHGKQPSWQTLLRWCQSGVRGQKLEWVRIGGSICTSLPAILRFIEKISAESSKRKEGAQ
jgi:hypothetical protein